MATKFPQCIKPPLVIAVSVWVGLGFCVYLLLSPAHLGPPEKIEDQLDCWAPFLYFTDENLVEFPRSTLEGCPYLIYFTLENNRISTLPSFANTSGFPALTQLVLTNNSISSIDSDFLSGFPILENLHLASNNFSGEVPEVFRSLSSIHTLDISHNRLSGVLNLSAVLPSSLEVLDMSNNQISGVILGCTSLESCRLSLKELGLGSNRIKRLGPDTFPRSLRRLYFSHNELDTLDPWTFYYLDNLDHVDLSYNQLEILTPQMMILPSKDKIKGKYPFPPDFAIHGNPFRCNCFLFWLTMVLKQYREKSFDRYNHDMPIIQYYEEELTCRSDVDFGGNKNRSNTEKDSESGSSVFKLAELTEEDLCPSKPKPSIWRRLYEVVTGKFDFSYITEPLEEELA